MRGYSVVTKTLLQLGANIEAIDGVFVHHCIPFNNSFVSYFRFLIVWENTNHLCSRDEAN